MTPISNNKGIVKTLKKTQDFATEQLSEGHGLQVDFSSHHRYPCAFIWTVYVQLLTNSSPSIRIKTAVFTHGTLFLWGQSKLPHINGQDTRFPLESPTQSAWCWWPHLGMKGCKPCVRATLFDFGGGKDKDEQAGLQPVPNFSQNSSEAGGL